MLLEVGKLEIGVAEGMGEVEDRAVGGLTVDAAEREAGLGREAVEDHVAGLADRGELGRVAEEDQGGEEFPEVVELAVVDHRGLVDEADVERVVAALPALDEVRAAQPGGGERARHRAVGGVEGVRAVHGGGRHALDLGARAAAGQPFGELLVFGVVERRVEDAVDRRRRHAAAAQHARGLVGGGEHGERALGAQASALVVGGDRLDA
jgi:hypothetical protein